jgi:hypothetical protein
MTDPDPRLLFIEVLIETVKKYESDPNNSCIVMMDANEAIADKEVSLKRIFRQTKLVDAFHLHTGSECTIPTYSRGTKRIDFILTSHSLVKFIENIGYTAKMPTKVITEGLYSNCQKRSLITK